MDAPKSQKDIAPRHYVSSRPKSGRPPGVRTTRGTLLTPKGEKMVAERERKAEAEVRNAKPSAFRREEDGLYHSRCEVRLEVRYQILTPAGAEWVFFCRRCNESVYIPLLILRAS